MPTCSCNKCVSLCERNPGWMTPDEALKAIAAGHAKRLMCDWLEPCHEVGNKERIYVLAPASIGCEGKYAPEFPSFTFYSMAKKGRCTFLNNRLCDLHTTDYKPMQCRETMGCGSIGLDNYEMARMWDNDQGRKTIAWWLTLTKQNEALS